MYVYMCAIATILYEQIYFQTKASEIYSTVHCRNVDIIYSSNRLFMHLISSPDRSHDGLWLQCGSMDYIGGG